MQRAATAGLALPFLEGGAHRPAVGRHDYLVDQPTQVVDAGHRRIVVLVLSDDMPEFVQQSEEPDGDVHLPDGRSLDLHQRSGYKIDVLVQHRRHEKLAGQPRVTVPQHQLGDDPKARPLRHVGQEALVERRVGHDAAQGADHLQVPAVEDNHCRIQVGQREGLGQTTIDPVDDELIVDELIDGVQNDIHRAAEVSVMPPHLCVLPDLRTDHLVQQPVIEHQAGGGSDSPGSRFMISSTSSGRGFSTTTPLNSIRWTR